MTGLQAIQEDWRVNDESPFVWPELAEVMLREESLMAYGDAAALEWLAAHVFQLHNSHVYDPCECGFCRDYRDEHGADIDPSCDQWETRRVTYRARLCVPAGTTNKETT